MRVLVVGAGGHAKVCVESLRDCGHDVVGAVTSDGEPVEGFGVDVVASDADLRGALDAVGADAVFVAVGDNAARAAVVGRAVADGLVLVNAVSRFAMVSSSAVLADGVAVMAGAVINAGTSVGRGAVINSRAGVDHDCTIGEGAHVAPGAVVCGGVSVGAGALVGVGARVLPNRTVGDGAVVGGGAVVVDDVVAGVTVVGVPARPITERRS